MSGPDQVPVPSEHPNDDLLADLAAEVLPEDLAGHVQDHVMACPRCAALLADAEGIRSMLLQIEPEQMPDEVLARLERALLAARHEDEVGARGAGTAGDAPETRALTRLPLGSDSGRADPGRRIARSGNPAAPGTGRIAATGPLTGSMAAAGPKTGRLSRMSAPAQSARRQAIEEQKADQPSRLSRLSPMLRIAAAVLVVVGAGAVTVQLRGDSAGSADQGATAVAGRAAPIIAPVQSTKTDYAKSALPKQVKSLIASSQKLLTQEETAAQDQSTFAVGSTPPSSGKVAAPDAAAQSPSAQGQQLRSPAALRACLTAIGAAQVQPVAVDLARYAGREAAIIVVPADGGGYDVWVVARDCRADSDGAIDFVTVKP